MRKYKKLAKAWLDEHLDTDIFPPLDLKVQGVPEVFCEYAFKKNGKLRTVVQLAPKLNLEYLALTLEAYPKKTILELLPSCTVHSNCDYLSYYTYQIYRKLHILHSQTTQVITLDISNFFPTIFSYSLRLLQKNI